MSGWMKATSRRRYTSVSSSVQWCAVLLQSPLVTTALCRYVWQQTFAEDTSIVIIIVYFGAWLDKHNTRYHHAASEVFTLAYQTAVMLLEKNMQFLPSGEHCVIYAN